MVETRYKIKSCPLETKAEDFCMLISLKTAEKLNLIDKCSTILQCGAKGLNISIIISSDPELTDDLIWLSQNVLEELFIPENIEIDIQVMDKSNIIKLGPVIGILTENFILKDHKKGCYIREDINGYAEAGNKIGSLLYIFSLSKIDLERKRIHGYVPQMNKSKVMSWQEQWVPIPDAIHNRIKISPSNPKYKKINAISALIPNMKIINRTTKVYKWTIQKILEKDNKAKEYLPKTILYTGLDTLTKMLLEFPSIYLKPVDRSLGLGIIKIEKNGQDDYTARYGRKDDLHSLRGKLAEILAKLNKLMGKRTYIVQEGIPLATYKGNIFDLRATVQKDETNSWSISSWRVKVAAPGSIVTNAAAGGSVCNTDELMNSVFKHDATKIFNAINIACLDICKAIENRISGIGDLGLDIGITEAGKIYFIEANFREHRYNTGTNEDLESLENAIKKPIYYLNYLYEEQYENHIS